MALFNQFQAKIPNVKTEEQKLFSLQAKVKFGKSMCCKSSQVLENVARIMILQYVIGNFY